MESNMSETQSLCGSEVTRKIKRLEVQEARAPVPHSWRRQWEIPTGAYIGKQIN